MYKARDAGQRRLVGGIGLKRKIVFFSFVAALFILDLIVLYDFLYSRRENISVLSPMTLSNHDLYHVNGQNRSLRLKMIQGTYREDWAYSNLMGPRWEGEFVIEVADESGRTVATTSLNAMYGEPLTFYSPFTIWFDDYNGDGDPDFTIGQKASTNGNLYRLFTLRSDGRVEPLPVEGEPLFISVTTGIHSTKLDKAEDRAFFMVYYDQPTGKYFKDLFRWDGRRFVWADHSEINLDN